MITSINQGINASRLDPNALSFISSAKITDTTQIRAINDLCKELKEEGIWNNLEFAFPFVYNGTTQSMLVDLVNPQRSLQVVTHSAGTFSGIYRNGISITFSTTGVEFSRGASLESVGTFSFTNFLGSGTVQDYVPPMNISVYTRKNSLTLTASNQYGVTSSAHSRSNSFLLTQNRSSTTFYFGTSSVGFSYFRDPGQSGFNNTSPNTWPHLHHLSVTQSTSGFWIYSNDDNGRGTSASVNNIFTYSLSQNGQILSSFTSSKNFSSTGTNICLGGHRYNGGVNTFQWGSLDEICWFAFGKPTVFRTTPSIVSTTWNDGGYIPTNKHQVFYEIIQRFQTKLGRQV